MLPTGRWRNRWRRSISCAARRWPSLAALEDPATAEGLARELERQQAQLDRLRGPGSKWSQVLADGFADVVGDADHRFRSALREITREVEQEIEEGGDPGKRWPEFTASVRERVGGAADRLLSDLDTGGLEVQRRIVALLADEEGIAVPVVDARGFDADSLWAGKPLERLGVGHAADSTIATLRGGQSGITMLNIISGLAGISVSLVATAGVGVFFGGKQILDERKRHLQAKRQQARIAIRQFTDDVQFEAGKRLRDLSRDLQRSQRDYFAQRIQDLYRTASESLAATQSAMKKSAAERDTAAVQLRQRIEQLSQFASRIADVEARL